MNGLAIWAQIKCRSVMELYRQMAQALEVPLIVPIWHEKPLGADIRKNVGFKNDEFSDISSVTIGDDFRKGIEFIETHRDWRHIFCVYQSAPVFRRLIVEAKRRTGKVGVMSEAPCNMSNGLRGLAKEFYLHFILGKRLREVTTRADFFVNYSGYDNRYLHSIGWSHRKVIPFGYFPPPIPGSYFHQRDSGTSPFVILSSGVMTWHRGVDTLVEALRLLSDRGVEYRAVITQDGPLYRRVKAKALRYNLPIEFTGFVPLDRLINLYETCSVYVGAGRHEPWGMRLNDVLNCGAPLVVSRGMGGAKLVDDYGCGATFQTGNSRQLADILEKMISDKVHYSEILKKTAFAAEIIKPDIQSRRLVGMIDKVIPEWFGEN